MRIYDGDLEDKFNLESSSFLQVNSCGLQVLYGSGMVSIRKKGRMDFHIVYLCEGKCDVEYEGKTETIHKGGFVLYPPNVPQKYKTYENSKTLWLHFNGYSVEKVLEEAKLHGGIYHICFSSPIEKMLVQLISEHNGNMQVSNEKGVLLSIIYTLGKLVNNEYSRCEKINDCISFIVMNYNMPINISELAAYCNLSRSRFMRLFAETAGMPPHTYQQMLRINNSKAMLSSTDLNIADISRLCGYDDPLYFSRVFKKAEGISPKQFREKTM